MNKEITEHRFGGPWTEIKLKALRDYLHYAMFDFSDDLG